LDQKNQSDQTEKNQISNLVEALVNRQMTMNKRGIDQIATVNAVTPQPFWEWSYA
jgi:hypothetical protein